MTEVHQIREENCFPILLGLTDDFRLWFYFLDISCCNCLQFVPFFIHCGFGFFLSSELLEWKLACAPGHGENSPQIFFASVFPDWHQLRLELPDAPSAVILLNARHCRSSIFFQFQTRVSHHHEVTIVIGQYLIDSYSAIYVSCVSWQILSKLPATYCLVW